MLDPIKKMLFRLVLCDLKNSIKEDPQKAIEKIDVYIKGLDELEQNKPPQPAEGSKGHGEFLINCDP